MSSTYTETESQPLAPDSYPFSKPQDVDFSHISIFSHSQTEKMLATSPEPELHSMDTAHVLLHSPADNGKTDFHLKEVVEHTEVARPAPILGGTATPPIAIGSSPAASGSQSRVRDRSRDEQAPLEKITGASEILNAKARRKKKRAQKAQAQRAQAEPAISTVRGFITPPVGKDNDSVLDGSVFQRRDISVHSSVANSPLLKPLSRPESAMGGISALRLSLDKLDLASARKSALCAPTKSAADSVTESSRSSSTDRHRDSTSESDRTETVSYEVPLDEDFTSKETAQQDADPASPLFKPEDVHRKMTAADFNPLLCLGKGTFGTVLLVRQRATGRLFAQKTFRKASLTVHKTLVEQTKSERTILEAITRHPFIVSLHYAFQDHAKLYLILEYASGGELFTHLAEQGHFPEPTAAFYMAELVLALDHLHRAVGVVYRDLKPENCLLDARGHLLLTDFGLSKVAADDATCRSILGTVEYMAPEVVRGSAYGTAVDWWSLGALGCDLLTGRPPFGGGNHAAIQRRILRDKPNFPHFLTPDARDLLTRLLRKEPGKRLGAHMPKDLTAIKGHRFFRSVDWRKLEKREVEPPIRPRFTDPSCAGNFAAEFTGLPLSPVLDGTYDGESEAEGNPFGGFSYVASRSVLGFD